ncbi:MAG: histidine kinase dimerization/phosphoacceptor domain -containing protein, partial [Spirochaetaceae bacterium]|nr:histidine kinase dimerization/phosphoacceptor domain -containing protein [Spirochaetaceae bacterium]
EAIARDIADAGVCIYSLGSDLARRYPVEATAISFSPIALGFAVTEGKNADLIAAIDREMASMVTDPGSEYSALTKKWTARLLPSRIPPWVPWGLAILLLSASLFAVLALMLRKTVAAKTRHLVIEIAEREKAETALRRSLDEKTALVHELFHRTKNILQIIEGMVALGASAKPDDVALQELADSTVVRIEALALVHEMLYRAQDLSYLSFPEYVRKLSGAVIAGFPGAADRIAVELDMPEERMLLDIVAPLGLVLNELLTNSAKHAFPDGRRGTIRIRFAKTSAGSYELRYSDDGIGLPPGFDPSSTPTLGLRIVSEISEKQLRGTASFRAQGGFEFLLDMPRAAYQARV